MSDTKGATGSSANSRSAERVVVDADGARWRVYEQEFAEYDRRRGLSLIFASDAAVRRVRNYPADWPQISNDELMTLSWKA